MCKIMCIVGISEEKNAEALRFAKTAVHILSKHDNDGFGYAAVSRKHGLFGERWVNNHQAFNLREPYAALPPKLAALGEDAFVRRAVYRALGEPDPVEALKDVSVLTLHARAATNGAVNVSNTHPFIVEGVSLIHNGIVDQAGLKNLYSHTDSEGILLEYLNAKVHEDAERVQDMANKLWGYYACAVLAPDKDGRYFLDIFKDPDANLHAAYVREMDAVVFCTSPGIIEDVCRLTRFTVSEIFEVEEELLIRIDPEKCELISQTEFRSMGSRYGRSQYSGYGATWDSDDYREGLPEVATATKGYDPDEAELEEIKRQIEEDVKAVDVKMREDVFAPLTRGWPEAEEEDDVEWEWENDMPVAAGGRKK